MARDYWFAFGSRPAANTGLAPTFITFVNSSGTTLVPPTITETYAGSGLYKSNYNATQTISFVLDGATTGLADSIRYIMGVFDPQDQFGQTLLNTSDRTVTLIAMGTTMVGLGDTAVALGITSVALGTTSVALGNTAVALGNTGVAIGATTLGYVSGIGDTSSTYGSSSQDPVTLYGYMKRLQEFLEGNQSYTKATGALIFSSRAGATTLASKTVSDTVSSTTKT